MPCGAALTPAPPTTVSAVDQTVVLWRYDETTAPLVTAAKSLGGSKLMKRLALPLAQQLRPYARSASVITWIPPSPRGRRRRGFDQGRILATRVGQELQVPVAAAFVRFGRGQFGGSRSVRLEGPRLGVRGAWLTQPQREQILLIDDVITTGASVSTAARLLRHNAPGIDIVAAALAVRA